MKAENQVLIWDDTSFWWISHYNKNKYLIIITSSELNLRQFIYRVFSYASQMPKLAVFMKSLLLTILVGVMKTLSYLS